ncbi:uncharacterized protein LOC111064835 [Drosophila obscura]|uniref:uncharacterized protein LOC111064835 n=1 Tax=Drosophila obscura TaxID=7282 RepID=UPI001BB1F895|nr:uncharacterized protein LOC111064835 [Drosophila obscura]
MLEAETESETQSETETGTEEEQLRLNQSIDRHVPQLVQLLLGIPDESTGNSANYEQFVASAKQTLAVAHYFGEQSADDVKAKLSEFMLQLHLRGHENIAKAIEKHTKTVLTDPWLEEHPVKEFQCRLIEFYLSISNLKDELCPEEDTRARENLVNRYMEASRNGDLDFEIDSDTDSNVANSNLFGSDLRQEEVDAAVVSPRSLPEVNPCPEAILQERCNCGGEFLHRSFATDYGGYLYEKLLLLYVEKPMDEKKLLLRELLVMFFLPHNCIYFVMVDQRIQLRIDAPQIVQMVSLKPILESLWQMQQLRRFIDRCLNMQRSCDRLQTFICFAQGLERLLLPVMQFLVDYDRRVREDTDVTNVQHFLCSSASPMERIQLLADMLPRDLKLDTEPPDVCCLKLLGQLHDLSSKPQTAVANIPSNHAALAATLLLHSLEGYCRILDTWWQTGDFRDHSGELPYRQQYLDGMTSFMPRELDRKSRSCVRFIDRHVRQAAPFVATLCDTQRNEDFVTTHKSLFKVSLYHEFVSTFLSELWDYHVRCYVHPRSQFALPMLEQLVIAYHKDMQGHMDHPSIHDILESVLACAAYVPLPEIIQQTLKQLLHKRLLLVRCYTQHLLQKELHLQDKLQCLVGVCMGDVARHQQKYERFFELLEDNQLPEASWKLKDIFEEMYSQFSSMIFVDLPGSNLAEISLKVPNDKILQRVVTPPLMELLNISFRLNLRMHQAQWMLAALPQLPEAKAERPIQVLVAVKNILAFNLRHPGKPDMAQKIHSSYLKALQKPFANLEDLRLSSHKFAQRMSELLSQSTAEGDPEEILAWAQLLKKLWLRTLDLLDDGNAFVACPAASPCFQLDYKLLDERYLQTILRRCCAMTMVAILQQK